MRQFAEFIGWAFLVLLAMGALLPGFAVHLFAGSEGKALEWHKEAAAAIQEAKEAP
ncbi:hypothetical protein ACFIQF_13030 [Comamonas sp. J-3]|uniref:hypothetical protein n=1 Tax=Comamonas trifloxystrobinivorans TaxID=3350256 RepID=UPI0037285F98